MSCYLTLGARLNGDGVNFKVWAPERTQVDVAAVGKHFPLANVGHGYWEAFVPGLKAGVLYKFRLDGIEEYPDPCSRFQPQGPHGPSMVVDRDFPWQDGAWQSQGLEIKGQVLYELHVGTYTPEGTYGALSPQLEELKDLGITVIELMPLGEFPGRFNWGYDGVNFFAPYHGYGTRS
jgi:maltooligosyltrehalose trehalohydrolase